MRELSSLHSLAIIAKMVKFEEVLAISCGLHISEDKEPIYISDYVEMASGHLQGKREQSINYCTPFAIETRRYYCHLIFKLLRSS